MNMMNILIDSGNCRNIGDNAMLLNVLDFLTKNLNGTFYVVDKGVTLPLNSFMADIRMLNKINDLLKMPYWRLRDHKTPFGFLKYICTFIFWMILIIRMIKIAFGVKFYKKTKAHIFTNSDIRYWTEILSQMDAYWVVGGGNINDIWIEQAFWKMVFAWIFKLQGKPVIFSGQGIGPAQRLSSKLILRFGIRQITLLSLREDVSLDTLKSLNIKPKNCYVVGDDALTLPEDNKCNLLSLPREFIALNLRMSTYSFQEGEVLDKYIRLVEMLSKKYPALQFIFIPTAFNKGDSDIESAKKVIEKIKENKNRIGIFEETVSWENIKFIFKNATFSFGVSYHFCLFSLAMGIPTVGLYANDYYRQKLIGLMQMFDNSNGVFDLRRCTVEDLFYDIEQYYREFNISNILSAKKRMEHNWHNFMSLAISAIRKKQERSILLNQDNYEC